MVHNLINQIMSCVTEHLLSEKKKSLAFKGLCSEWQRWVWGCSELWLLTMVPVLPHDVGTPLAAHLGAYLTPRFFREADIYPIV